MKPIRTAVVGVGHLGRHHARILGAMPGVELVGVADSRPEQAEAIAEQVGTRAFHDFRDLIGQVDAVSIAVPTVLHRDVAGAFLGRGISSMVEKPLAGTPAEAEELVEIARSTGAMLQVGHIERFNPAFDVLRKTSIRPRYLTTERLSSYTFRSTDVGVVSDLMIHDIDLVLSLVQSPVRSVSAVGVSLFSEHEDVANARIEFQDGSVANLTASRASYAAIRKMRIWGAEGYASLDFGAKSATLVHPSQAFLDGELDLAPPDLSQPALVKEHLFGKVLDVEQVQAEGREQLALELEDFVSAVRDGRAPRVTGEDGLKAVLVADQIVRAIQAHRWEAEAAAALGGSLSADVPSGLRGPHAWRLDNAAHQARRRATSSN